MDMNKLREALEALDPANDGHWTSDDLPRLDVVKDKSEQDVSRAELSKAFPNFTRKNPSLEGASGEEDPNAEKDPAAPSVENQAPAPAPAPAPTPPQTSPTPPDEDEELDAFQALEKAQQDLAAAQKRHKAALAEADKAVAEKERAQDVPLSKMVRSFQKSERERLLRQTQSQGKGS